jgi:hypothetical protein
VIPNFPVLPKFAESGLPVHPAEVQFIAWRSHPGSIAIYAAEATATGFARVGHPAGGRVRRVTRLGRTGQGRVRNEAQDRARPIHAKVGMINRDSGSAAGDGEAAIHVPHECDALWLGGRVVESERVEDLRAIVRDAGATRGRGAKSPGGVVGGGGT